LCRWRFAKITGRLQQPDVSFIVAAALRGRPNVIERAKAVALMERFRLGQVAYTRNWLPNVLLEVLMTPAEATHIALAQQPAGVLCVLSSPDFQPRYYSPLSAIAIGSGAAALAQIDHEADWVFAGDVGNIHVETDALVQAVRHYTVENRVPGVGGLFCCMKVSNDGCRMTTFSMEMPDGTRIELSQNVRGRLEQRNRAKQKAIELRLPWEVGGRAPAADERFDDLDEFERTIGVQAENELNA
jgi:hypothetical protein